MALWVAQHRRLPPPFGLRTDSCDRGCLNHFVAAARGATFPAILRVGDAAWCKLAWAEMARNPAMPFARIPKADDSAPRLEAPPITLASAWALPLTSRDCCLAQTLKSSEAKQQGTWPLPASHLSRSGFASPLSVQRRSGRAGCRLQCHVSRAELHSCQRGPHLEM